MNDWHHILIKRRSDMKKGSLVLTAVLLIACVAGIQAKGTQEQKAGKASEVTIWFHGGTADETEAMRAQIKRFNDSQTDFTVVMTEIPGSCSRKGYNDSVNAAAVAGKLPDILDLDGPNLYNYAWAGFLLPLDGLVDKAIIADLLPSLIQQGTYQGKLYVIGQYDSGLALAGRRSLLKKAGMRIPSGIKDAWTKAEFLDGLAKLKALPEVKYPIDLKLNYGAGEWMSYAFSPVLQGFGGDLIERKTYQTAEGVLNGPEGVAALQFMRDLIVKGYANPTPIDDNDFLNGYNALGVCGHWMTKGYYDTFKEDFVLLPMPIWDKKAVTGMGSWGWAVSSQTKNQKGAIKFLEFMLKPEEILAITDINGAVPGRQAAFTQSAPYKEGGYLNVFIQQLQGGVAVPRPETPAYPAITTAFYTAMDNVLKGADPKKELDIAVDKIEKDIRDNGGYPQKK
jgi:multiple sugar transport system substrate-binding protein